MHAPSLPIDNTSPRTFERGDRCGGFIVHKTGGGNGESIPGQGKGIEGNDRRRSNIYFYLDAPERVHTSLPDAIWMTEGTCLSRGGCPSTDIRIRPIRGSLHPWFERFEIKDGRDLWTVTGISTKNRPEFAPRALPPSPPSPPPSIHRNRADQRIKSGYFISAHSFATSPDLIEYSAKITAKRRLCTPFHGRFHASH